MKLTTYLLGALVSVFSLQSIAQNSQEAKLNLQGYIQAPEIKQDVKIDYATSGAKNTVFSNEFDVSEEWILTNEGEQGTWAIVTETSPNVADYMGAMQSASAENGFGEFDGISFLLDADVAPQNSILEYNGSIDCSSLSDVAVTFNQRARAFNYDKQFLEISTNSGTSWIPFELNTELAFNAPAVQGEITIDITSVAAGEEDVRIRFRWFSDALSENPDLTPAQVNSFGSGYGWMIDDLIVSSLPENELIIGETFYDDHFETFFQVGDEYFVSEEYTDLLQVSSFEYHTQPDFSTRPFNFACGVTNGGTVEQTGVSLVITFTDPNDETWTDTSDPITLAPGVTDTIRFYGQIPSNWSINGNGDLPNGLYTIDYEVIQDQDDELPGNNVGVSLFTRISDEESESGSFIQHENSLTFLANDGQDIIAGTRYTFSTDETNKVITSIRFALNDESEDGIGEQLFLNVRTGGVLDEENAENEMNLFFSYNEDDPDVVIYEVEEEDLSATSTPVWIEVVLPTPILIEPGLIYQAELRLPLFGEELVFVGLTSTRKVSSSVLYDFDNVSTGPQGWFFLGGQVYNLAFGTDQPLNVPEISYESGIKLTQNYPNPVVDHTRIQFQLDEASAVTFEVFDITGKLVYSKDFGDVPALTNQVVDFNRADLAAGTYTYGVITETERLTRKMIIQ
ncbi:T9SS type A sorting domain-containing protein [Cryomorphaceae bacterium 1068]|nr:T9SS type A sorting domain-containing protein [Cryomorphaceae bacterium 1068]